MTSGAAGLRRAVRRRVVRPTGVRRHLAPGLSLDEFFARLRAHGVSYVVLRWFEALPHVDDGEDIDLLVADGDLAFVRSLMSDRSGASTQKFDIYSESGLPGSDFHGVPYYSPQFSSAVLDSAQWLRERYRVPDLQHHYDSLAYHAVYHKGYASGLPDGVGSAGAAPSDHDYSAVLTGLAERLGRPLHSTLDSLDRYLAERDLRPPLDTLERLEPRNPWIHDRFFADQPPVDDLWRGLAVFVLRERARPQVDAAVRELDRQGLEVLEVLELDNAQQEAARRRLRGGNWAQGPWPLSGGGPATYVVAYDVAPRLASLDDDRATNLRLPVVKEKVRAQLLDGVVASELYNPVHSSDNPRQALDYLAALGAPDVVERVRPAVERLVDSCAFPAPVVRALPGQARRAQVAVVDHPIHGLSVCKVFRPGAARFFERELRARKDLADLPEVPDLLESGERWILTTLYSDGRSHVRRYLPGREDAQLTRAASLGLTRFALALHERGLFLLDLSTHNVVSDPVRGLKVLDLEFLQEYEGAAPAMVDSYTLRGVPAGAHGYDVPQRTTLTRGAGGSAFAPQVTGASPESLLRPHRPLDAQRRAAGQLRWYLVLLLQQRYRTTRRAAGASRWGRDVRALRKGLSARRRRP